MQSLAGEGYSIEFDDTEGCVCLRGSLRLGGLAEYAPLSQLLEDALETRPDLTLDLTRLEFLNSSGIATLSRFVINARNRKTSLLTIRGSNAIAWQSKSLNNLKRLMPTLDLQFD